MSDTRIAESYNTTPIDLLNTSNSESFKDIPESGVVIRAIAFGQDENGTMYSYLFGSDGTTYGGNSSGVYRSLKGYVDLMNTNPEYTKLTFRAIAKKGTSKSGKEFITLSFEEVI